MSDNSSYLYQHDDTTNTIAFVVSCMIVILVSQLIGNATEIKKLINKFKERINQNEERETRLHKENIRIKNQHSSLQEEHTRIQQDVTKLKNKLKEVSSLLSYKDKEEYIYSRLSFNEIEECHICYDRIESNNLILPRCSHYICSSCHSQCTRCPTCRAKY